MSNIIRWFSPNSLDGHFQAFSYKDGLVYTDNLSEELDSMTIVVPRETKHKFEPFDKVEVFNNNFTSSHVMLIDSIVENQVTFDTIPLYDYTIKLMSLTKGLERVVLPNISITKTKGGTAKTLYTVIAELLEDYSPKKLDSNNLFAHIYHIDPTDSSVAILTTTPCPDMQMSKPTLREAIDRVLSVVKSICYVKYNLFVYVLDLDKRNNPIDLTNLSQINYQDESQSSSDYASELENTYNNVTPNTTEHTRNFTTMTEYTGFRNNNTALLTTDNMHLETNFPIYSIQNVRIMGWCSGTDSQGGQVLSKKIDYDITSYIKEKKEFDILSYNEKQKSLFYSRGSNIIAGNAETYGWWIFVETGLENILKEVTGFLSVSKISGTSSLAETLFFKITYQSQADNIRAKSGKYLPETNENNSMIDNPSEAFVDIKQQGTLFNQKVNRLGNRAKVLTGRFKIADKSLIPSLGDYLDDFVVINRELQYRDNFILVKLILTENYVNINYFTGINARKRSWQIVGSEEALNKQVLDKWYCELSFSQKQGTDNTSLNDGIGNKLAYSLANPVNYTDIKYVAHAIITNNYLASNYSDDKKYVELDLNSYISGNSLIFNFGFLDNYSAPLSLGNGTLEGGIPQYYNKYVDSNGFCNSFNILLLNNNFIDKYNFNEETDSVNNNLINYSKQKPRLTISNYSTLKQNNVVYDTTITNHKDNRETPNFNIQFEFCSDTPDIVIGRKFIERQQVLSTLYCSNSLINNYINFSVTPSTPVYEQTQVAVSDHRPIQVLQEAITPEYQNYSSQSIETGNLVGTAQVYEEQRSEYTYRKYTNTQFGNNWYSEVFWTHSSFLENTNIANLLMCQFNGLSTVLEIESVNNIATGNIKCRIIGTAKEITSDTLVIVKKALVTKNVYGVTKSIIVSSLLGYEPAEGISGTPGYGGINNLTINSFTADDFTNTITKQKVGGVYTIFIYAYSFTQNVYISYSFRATSYRANFTTTIDPNIQNINLSYLPVSGQRLDSRNTLSYNPENGIITCVAYGDNYDSLTVDISWSYYTTTSTVVGYYDTYNIFKSETTDLDIQSLTITGDSRNTVSFNKGMFTYTVYSTGSSTTTVNGAIEYGYYGKSYKLYYCSKKYKYGDEKLHDSINESSNWNYTASNSQQYYSFIDISHSDGPYLTAKSLAIVDNDGNLILAINKEFNEYTRYSTSLYLNILRTRDRKKYLDSSMKEWQ